MKRLFFFNYSIEDIMDILDELNEKIASCFDEEDLLFSVEYYNETVMIKFKDMFVASEDNRGGWEYDYEKGEWAYDLKTFLAKWLVTQSHQWGKITSLRLTT
jgi:hemerythrin